MKSGSTSEPNTHAGHLSQVKSETRRHFRALRESMTRSRVAAVSQAICQRLSGWQILREAHAVLSYIAFRNELDLVPLIERLPGIDWVVPRVVGRRLVLHPYDPARLVRHRYGMLEPAADLPTIEPTTLDLVLVPGVAYDRCGGRMGFGGGF